MMDTLLIGGTGPTGRHIVAGLLERGHRVSLLHTGQHETELPPDIEHIHTDPHFAEPMQSAIGNRHFDLVIATYGRTRVIADVFANKTGRLITASGAHYATATDPRWGPVGAPALAREGISPVQDQPHDRPVPHKVWKTERHLLARHDQGAFDLTILRYPNLVYGPSSAANPDWSAVKRALDGRPYLLMSEGGLRFRNRGFSQNVAQAVLLASDKSEVTAGKIYDVADVQQFTEGAIALYIGRLLGQEFEIIDIPAQIAQQVHQELGKYSGGFSIFDTSPIQEDLGFADIVPVPDAIALSVEWLRDNPIAPDSEIAKQINDPFDYELEDELARIYLEARDRANELQFRTTPTAHMYRHPKQPFETWTQSTESYAANQPGLP
jgi:nucleoside-diphosphate-sugar epimerase